MAKGTEAIRVRVAGSDFPKIAAYDMLLGEKNLIPSAIRLCVTYFLSFGTYPCIAAVSEKSIRDTAGYVKCTILKFEPDERINKLLKLLSSNGRIQNQRLRSARGRRGTERHKRGF